MDENGAAILNRMADKTPEKPIEKKTARGAILSPIERRKIAGSTLVHEDTILRWERGDDVRPATRRVLEAAARAIKAPVPDGRKRP